MLNNKQQANQCANNSIQYELRLSPYANTFYTEWQLNPDSARYNLVIDQTLYGNLEVAKLKHALHRYITEHIILNSHIRDINNVAYWVPNQQINELEYTETPVATSELLKYVKRSFDLHHGPLYRFKLVRLQDNVYRFIAVFHHLLVDGSSSLDAGVFTAIANYYNDDNYTTQYSIPEQIDLITKLTTTLTTKLAEQQPMHTQFWRQHLADTSNVDLGFLKLASKATRDHAITTINFSYDANVLAQLKQLKSQYAVTPYLFSKCIFAMLLHRYTGQERITISYPIAIKEGLDFIYGAQINTNLITYQFQPETTVAAILNQSREFFHHTIRNDIQHGYQPIADIMNSCDNKNLLDVNFVQTCFREQALEFNGITQVELHTELSVDGVAAEVLLFEQDARNTQDQLNYRIRYDKNTIDTELLNNFIASYQQLFMAVLTDLLANDSQKPVASYDILSPEQYQKIVYEFNQTKVAYPCDKTIHQLFEEQVLKTPNNIAVVYENTKLTYQELNQKANQLAHYLQQNYCIQPDDLVALCLDRSEQMLIAIFGVLKAGGAYVPIDPNYPDERIGHILSDTNTKVVLINHTHINKLQRITKQKNNMVDILPIDNATFQNKLGDYKNSNSIISIISNNLMYVIYTSGTTGNPKGVMIEHRSAINYITYLIKITKLNQYSKGSSYASFGFDASVADIYPILLSGGILYIISEQEKLNLSKINNFFHKNNINYAFLPTKIAELFFELENSSLTSLLIGGEKINKFVKRSYQVINAYGPTETTVQPTSFIIDQQYDNIPIGKPINNVTCYVLDKNLNILPIGAVGELHIGGQGLARGYLNNPGLTTEKFIANPWQTPTEKSTNQNARLYKTGDLVRLLPDGNLEYIGRNDSQVKIRGYRIELGEITNQLMNYPGIKQAVVLAQEHTNDRANKYLSAYYVADSSLDETKIQNYLATKLPPYMLPAILIHLTNLPTTTNGKLDQKSLPQPNFANNSNYVAPSNEPESIICKIFAQTLGIEMVGIEDDFFLLGGNSLKAIELVAKLHANFDIKVLDVFKLRTPAKLAAALLFGKDVLKQKLEQLKLVSCGKPSKQRVLSNEQQTRLENYWQEVNGIRVQKTHFSFKPITNVLLTGSTGFLGCNLLHQLLTTTNYRIFLLIRADSQATATARINHKFQYYFDEPLNNIYGERVVILNAELEDKNLGLSSEKYLELSTIIDSTIHTAALVKHYGDYEQFYLANVQTTINLLEFTKLTNLKDFHYISTYSVLGNDGMPIYTESDLPDDTKQEHVYIKTKLQGEYQTIKYRDYGITSNIYRVGNLAFMLTNARVQENLEENAFFNWLKCLLKLQGVTHELKDVEPSPTDLTAQAIIKLFDKQQLSNETYHVFNPYRFDVSTITNDNGVPLIPILPKELFIDTILDRINNNIDRDLIVRFLLHQGWLNNQKVKNITVAKILQDKTQSVLSKLGFTWPHVTIKTFMKYLDNNFS